MADFANHERGLVPRRLFCGVALSLAMSLGCDQAIKMAPVKGKVLYNGVPLQFGSVMFQSEEGQPSRGDIQPDGTFELSTNSPGDGAYVGANRVRITCTTAQRPKSLEEVKSVEAAVGKSLIPDKYAHFGLSGLQYEVKTSGNDDVVFDLKNE